MVRQNKFAGERFTVAQFASSGPTSPRSPGWWAFSVWLLVAVLLTFSGFMGTSVVPSLAGEKAALFAAFVASVALGLFAAKDRSFQADNSYFAALSARYAFVADRRLRVSVFALGGFLLTFLAVERGAIAIWTSATGTPGERTVTVARYHRGGRILSCEGFYLRETPFTLTPAICTEQFDALDARPPGPGATLRIYGKSTMLGIVPDSLEVAPTS